MVKRDNRLKELKRLRYEVSEMIESYKKELKKINREVNRLERDKTLERKRRKWRKM